MTKIVKNSGNFICLDFQSEECFLSHNSQYQYETTHHFSHTFFRLIFSQENALEKI